MSHSSRYRSSSPSSRHMVDPMRASTGTVSVSSPTSRYGYDGYLSPVSAAERVSDASYRGQLEAQRISSTTYRDPGQSAKLRTEYAIRPRSNTSSVADPNRRPLSVIIPTNTQPPVITSAHNRSASPLPPRPSHETERYVMPASSSYRNRRVYRSSGYGSDTGRLDAGERAGTGARRDSGVYRVYKPGGWSSYGDPRKEEGSDYYDAYSYTNPREQFENESQRPPHRTGRPLSMTGLENYLPLQAARKESRTQGPPPSQRGFDKLVEDDRVRRTAQTHADSDATRDSAPARRRSSQRTPVDVHQDRDPYKDDHDPRRHRRRHEGEGSGRQRRDDRDPRKHSAGEITNPVLGGLATLAVASGYAEDTLDHDPSSRREGHRSRGADRGLERDGGVESTQGHPHSSIKTKSKGTEGVGSEAHRRRTRTERHSRSDSEDTGSDHDLRKPKSKAATARRRRDSGSSDGSRSPYGDGHQSRRLLKDSVGQSSPETAERRLVAVDPTQEKEPEIPRSILKPPREKFPEDLNPIREGVAPLKDAHRKGIPPGARWTKIDRRLVNPAALDGRERFEERAEYVIVLRVLTREEIQEYAVRTQEIRGETLRFVLDHWELCWFPLN